jgi:hypothetical protein
MGKSSRDFAAMSREFIRVGGAKFFPAPRISATRVRFGVPRLRGIFAVGQASRLSLKSKKLFQTNGELPQPNFLDCGGKRSGGVISADKI